MPVGEIQENYRRNTIGPQEKYSRTVTWKYRRRTVYLQEKYSMIVIRKNTAGLQV